MDYSLLLGVHDRTRGLSNQPSSFQQQQQQHRFSAASGTDEEGGYTSGGEGARPLSDEPWSADEGPGGAGEGAGAVNFDMHHADEEGEHGVDRAPLMNLLTGYVRLPR